MMRAVWIGISAICLVVVSCSDDSGESSAAIGGGGGGSGGGASTIDACALVTASDATSLFGQPALKETGVTTPDPGLIGQCVWGYDAPDNSSQLLQIQVYNKDTYYSEPPGATPFTIGDKGYVAVGGLTGVDIGWIEKGKTVMLSYSTIGPSVPEASTKVEQVKALAKKVEAAL